MSLEDHIHGLCHLDNLTVHKAQSHVVIEHSVHILDPIRVNRAIKHDPFSFLVWMLIATTTENTAQDSICEIL